MPTVVWTAVLLVAAGAYFALAAGRAIDVPGLQYDEILFVNAATGEPTNGLFVAKRVFGIPVMLMGYIGALKAYLYYPVFQLFGVSPATIRWPVIAASLMTLGLTYGVARFSFGQMTSALLTLAIAVDPTFIYMTKLDFGPVVLMLLLKLAALWFALRTVSSGLPRYLWGMSVACALGMFDKLNFIWFLLALVVACGALFRGELAVAYRRHPRGFVFPLASLAAVTAAATVWLVLPQLLASQSAAQGVSLVERLPYVLRVYATTMSGQEPFLHVTGSNLTAKSLTNYVTAASLFAMLAWGVVATRRAGGMARLPLRQRTLACHLLLFVLIALQIWLTKKAWGPHHLMMLYPLQYFIAFGMAVTLAGAAGAALVTGAFVASSLTVGASYAQAFQPGAEFEPQWSPVVYDLVDYLNGRLPDRIVSVDWGIHNQVYALGTPRTRVVCRDRWPDFRTLGDRGKQTRMYQSDFQNRNVLAVLHGRGWDIMPTARANFSVWAASFGLTPSLDRTFSSPAGTTIFEVYSLDGAGTQDAPSR
ncbi:MAG: glycosyltransferase family 39 protein [Gemmatimonadales bacterium]|nr:glycosyltransferase family 39 protein [Gemmatimonadales bacterium]